MFKTSITVSQLNKYVSSVFQNDPIVSDVIVQGEVSNFKRAVSGHLYFTLKDNSASIRCVMFASNAIGLDFDMFDGMQIEANGYVTLYEKEGVYQLYVKQAESSGKGELFKKYEQLKIKLEKKGYFDQDQKPNMPDFPKTVGLVCSQTGAVLHDITEVIGKNTLIKIILCPASVQGNNAKTEIAQAIKKLNQIDEVDAIILARGGGSIEDLWAFNEEIVAEAIHKSKKPIISAVGHQTDFTIADFVATTRAATPSVAAEIIISDFNELIAKMDYCFDSIYSNMLQMVEDNKSDLSALEQELLLKSPKNKVLAGMQNLDYLTDKIKGLAKNIVPPNRIKLDNIINSLNLANPLNILKRGYTITQKDEKAVLSHNELTKGDKVIIMFSSGSKNATID